MIANALLAAAVVLLAFGLYVLQTCDFLIPYRSLLYHRYLPWIAGYALVLFLNLFTLFYLLGLTLFLKDTGRKLSHVDKQIRTGTSILEELALRLREEGHDER